MKKVSLIIGIVLCFKLSESQTLEYRHKLISPITSDTLLFRDSLIDVFIFPQEQSIEFELKNLSQNSIKLLWDECSIIIEDRSLPIIHGGVKYIEKEKPQTPTTIPSGTKISDMIVGKENIHYTPGQYGGWSVFHMYKKSYFVANDTNSLLKSGCFLSIETLSGKKEYKFIIETRVVKNIKEKPKKNKRT